jgi:hypothetical protein
LDLLIEKIYYRDKNYSRWFFYVYIYIYLL